MVLNNNCALKIKGECISDRIPKRGIDYFLDEITSFLSKENNKKNILFLTDKEKTRLRLVYKLCEDKFFNIPRKNGEKYLDHLIQTALIVVKKFTEPNQEKIIIALLHDIIEDTDIDFYTLKTLFGPKIAIAVLALSKDEIIITNDEDKRIVETSRILDENGEIKKKIKRKKRKYILSEIEKKALEIFEKYKNERNEKYYSHVESFESMFNHIKGIYENNLKFEIKQIYKEKGANLNENELKIICEKKGIILTENELKKITINSLDVKYADRIHNLSTQWDPRNINKVKIKAFETEKFFLNSARENNIDAYILLLEKLKNLGINIENSFSKTKLNNPSILVSETSELLNEIITKIS